MPQMAFQIWAVSAAPSESPISCCRSTSAPMRSVIPKSSCRKAASPRTFSFAVFRRPMESFARSHTDTRNDRISSSLAISSSV